MQRYIRSKVDSPAGTCDCLFALRHKAVSCMVEVVSSHSPGCGWSRLQAPCVRPEARTARACGELWVRRMGGGCVFEAAMRQEALSLMTRSDGGQSGGQAERVAQKARNRFRGDGEVTQNKNKSKARFKSCLTLFNYVY